MKKGVKKFITAIIIAIIIFNVFFPITSSADWVDDLDGAGYVVGAIDGIVGILYGLPKLVVFYIAKVVYIAISSLVSGFEDYKLTPDDIIFSGANGTNDIDLISINFFGSNDGVTKTVSEGIATWYYALRNLAIIVSLVVLIYVGIRMAISSVASEKAKYKQMLKDWAMGFAMLFVLHYLMIAVIALNKEFVTLIKGMGDSASAGNISNLVETAEVKVWSPFFTTGYGALLVYAIIIGITVAFFVQYVRRFFTIGFLITISPLITVTYSIDKMGDGKSQALNVWLREFIFNVVIQPFHCIIYTLLCTAAISSLTNGPGLKEIVVAVASLLFVFKAEDIVKNIFGFRAGSMENAAAAGALAWGVMSKFSSGSSKAAKATGKVAGNAGKSNAKDQKLRGRGSRTGSGYSGGDDTTSGKDSKVGFKPDKGIAGVLKNAANGNNILGKAAIGQAAAESIMNKVENLKQFEAAPGKTLAKAAGKLALKSTVNGFKLAPKLMTGGMVGGMTGNAVTGIAAGYVSEGGPLTGRFSRKMNELTEKDLGKLQEDSYIKRLANAYDDFRLNSMGSDGKFMSEEDLYNKCIELYDADISTLTDAAEIKLAKRIQEMRDFYDGRGEVDSAAKLLSKIDSIQSKGAGHAMQVKTEDIVNAATQYMGTLTGSSADKKSETIDMVNKIQQEINSVSDAGGNYWKSKQYTKDLSEEGKKLAKEIYKTKKLTTVVGNASQNKLDRDVNDKLIDKL